MIQIGNFYVWVIRISNLVFVCYLFIGAWNFIESMTKIGESAKME